jgi:uncharacterized protein YcbK (DUF882 family)
VSTPVTLHFTVEEFRCHSGEAYPVEWIDERLRPLGVVLEKLREELGGRPVKIVSGFRSPAHNAAVGGAKQSQHMAGRAADITVDGVAPAEVHATLLSLFHAGAIEIGGIGLYPRWVHVDVRQRPGDGHLCQWSGAKLGDEVA